MATLSGPDCVSPYYDADLLERQWRELNTMFTDGTQQFSLASGSDVIVLLLCYDGDTSRLASSILRAKGVEAFSLKGGALGISGPLGKLTDVVARVSVASDEPVSSKGAVKQ
jgi:hypothetical protein